MIDPLDELSLAAMESAAEASVAMLRAGGTPVPNDKHSVAIFKMGFAAGAAWLAAHNVKEAERKHGDH